MQLLVGTCLASSGTWGFAQAKGEKNAPSTGSPALPPPPAIEAPAVQLPLMEKPEAAPTPPPSIPAITPSSVTPEPMPNEPVNAPQAPANGASVPSVENSPLLQAQLMADQAGVDPTKIKDLLSFIADLEVRQGIMARELQKSKTDQAALQEENDRLKLQMQALGVSALSGDERSLQLRLLNAVSDYRIADSKQRLLTDQLIRICDAITAFQNSSDVSSRRRLDEALAESRSVLQDSAPAEESSPTPVEQAQVVSVRKELQLVVINAGQLSGLRMGMPLAIVRKDETIAQGIIVDCRETLCGVLLTSTPVASNRHVSVGDAIKLETNEPVK